MLYGTEVFGYITPSNFFLNTKKSSTPINAMMGDMGWTDIIIYMYIKELLCMIKYWNGL